MRSIDIALLVLRVALGITILLHGYQKVFLGGKLAGTGRWFESMGMKPGWLHARFAAATEWGSGILMIVGLLTPFAAAGIVGIMVVAGITAHRKNGFFIFRPGEGYEYVMNFALAAAAVGTIGPGKYSLDHAFDIVMDPGPALAVSAGLGVGAAALLLATCYRPVSQAS